MCFPLGALVLLFFKKAITHFGVPGYQPKTPYSASLSPFFSSCERWRGVALIVTMLHGLMSSATPPFEDLQKQTSARIRCLTFKSKRLRNASQSASSNSPSLSRKRLGLGPKPKLAPSRTVGSFLGVKTGFGAPEAKANTASCRGFGCVHFFSLPAKTCQRCSLRFWSWSLMFGKTISCKQHVSTMFFSNSQEVRSGFLGQECASEKSLFL